MSENEIHSSSNELEEFANSIKQQAAAENHNTKNDDNSNDDFDLEEAVSVLIPLQKKSKYKEIEEESKNSHNKSHKDNQSKFSLYLKLFLVLLVLAVIIYFVFFYQREDTFVINLPIPYVYYQPYLRSLETFAHLDCHNEVLIVSGPKGIGKSRGISTFIDNNFNIEGHSNRLVINFDCERLTQYSTDDDIVEFIRNSVLNGFRDLDNYVSSAFRSSPFANDKHYAEEQVSAISRAFQKKGFINGRRFNRPIRNPFLRSISKDFSNIISQMKNEPSFCINLLIQCIQIISPSLRPIIIINSPEKLYYLGHHSLNESFNSRFELRSDFNKSVTEENVSAAGSPFAKEIFDTFVKSFKRISHDTVQYGIIVEVSDLVWLSSMGRKYRGDIGIMNVIRSIDVDEFDVNDAKSQLTLRGMFKPQQVQMLYEEFGGYGPYFAQVHELMQQGLQFQDALLATKKSVFDHFLRTMGKLGLVYRSSGNQTDSSSGSDSNSLLNNQETKECYDFLNKLIRDYEITFKKKENVSQNLRDFIEAMVRAGIFSLRENRYLKFTSSAEMKSAQIFMQTINQNYQRN